MAQLYQGRFLAGINAEIPWVQRQRSQWEDRYLILLEKGADFFLRLQKPIKAQQLLAKQLEMAPLDESIHEKMMQCYQLMGKRSRAIKQYHHCRKLLREEYGLSPSKR